MTNRERIQAELALVIQILDNLEIDDHIERMSLAGRRAELEQRLKQSLATPKGWIGVDLDGTLALYDGWSGPHSIGEPIAPMVDRVKAWLCEGRDVRIFTARVAVTVDVREEAETAIRTWCKEHLGQELPITCSKDLQMEEIWDDRAVGVVKNKGIPKVFGRVDAG